MKALILAAGLGSRLKNKTESLPKALVNVSGKPILSYQIDALLDNKISDIVIVLGKEGHKIINYINWNYPNINIQFIDNPDYEKSNSSYSFWLAKDQIKSDSYIHLNCDIIFSSALLGSIIRDKNPNIIAVRTDLKLTDEMENVVIKEGKIIKMRKKSGEDSMGKAFGLAKFNIESTKMIIEKIEGYIQNGDLNQHCYGMIRELVNEIDYHSFLANEHLLLEVNTQADLILANNRLNNPNK
jgi:choline kinase